MDLVIIRINLGQMIVFANPKCIVDRHLNLQEIAGSRSYLQCWQMMYFRVDNLAFGRDFFSTTSEILLFIWKTFKYFIYRQLY